MVMNKQSVGPFHMQLLRLLLPDHARAHPARHQRGGPSRFRCLGCGLCQVTCPSRAIRLVEVRPADYVPERLFG